jgi:hypothetical protein
MGRQPKIVSILEDNPMKLVPVFCIAIVALSAVLWQSACYGQEMHRYKVRSAIVNYKVTGMQEGTETLYFDRWGMREARYTETEIKMMGMGVKTHNLTLLDGEFTYAVDLVKKTGTKAKTPMMEALMRKAESENQDLTDIGKDMMVQMGGKVIGEEEILGKTCQIWEISNMKTKTWIWNGITLKSETNMMGTQTSEATSIEVDVDIPEDKVTLPSDITIGDIGNPMDLIKNMKNKMRPPR